MDVDRQQKLLVTGTNAQYDVKLDSALDGVLCGPCHRYSLRVQYEDTDAGGIVYHAQYLAFSERARSAWLRCLGIDQSEMLSIGNLGFVVRRVEIDFLLPSGLGAVLAIESSLAKLGGATLKLHQKVINRDNGHILARLIVDIGFVTFANGKPPKICRLPEVIKTKFSGLMTKAR